MDLSWDRLVPNVCPGMNHGWRDVKVKLRRDPKLRWWLMTAGVLAVSGLTVELRLALHHFAFCKE